MWYPDVTIASRGWDKKQLSVVRDRRNGRVLSPGHQDRQPPGRAPNLGAASRRASCASVVGFPGGTLLLWVEGSSWRENSPKFSPLPQATYLMSRRHRVCGLGILPLLGSALMGPVPPCKQVAGSVWASLTISPQLTSLSTPSSLPSFHAVPRRRLGESSLVSLLHADPCLRVCSLGPSLPQPTPPFCTGLRVTS